MRIYIAWPMSGRALADVVLPVRIAQCLEGGWQITCHVPGLPELEAATRELPVDAGLAARLTRLEQAGCRTWNDIGRVLPGVAASALQRMEQELEAADALLVLLPDAAALSPGVAYEMGWAGARRIPVLAAVPQACTEALCAHPVWWGTDQVIPTLLPAAVAEAVAEALGLQRR